MVDIVNVSGIQ